jgi:hypothetical protein
MLDALIPASRAFGAVISEHPMALLSALENAAQAAQEVDLVHSLFFL